MKTLSLTHPEVISAIDDLKEIIGRSKDKIESVQIFGSTIKMPLTEAKDVDFFISYKNTSFEEMKESLLKHNLSRIVHVENHEAKYTNHPEWERENPLRLHILLYQEGKTEFTEKLKRTKKYSIDITPEILK